ncbi:MAG TPA: hypothetical protein VK901_04130 [Nitrospiraceae bacterium]|nr:hypothetical protein [Nitrospiraceae bacterium]
MLSRVEAFAAPGAFEGVDHGVRVDGVAHHAVLLVDGEDRPGALADLTDRLGSAKINMIAVTGLCAGQGRFGAILWVKPGDMKKAAKVFGIGSS